MTVPPELAPEAGISFGIVVVAIMCVFLIALSKAWEYSIGAMLQSLRNMFNSIGFTVPVIGKHISLSFIGDALGDIDSYVHEAIGTGIHWTKGALHKLIGAMSWALQETASQIAGLANDTANAFDWVKRNFVPTLIAAALLGPRSAISLLQRQVGELLRHPTQIITKTRDVIAPGLKALEQKVDKLEKSVAATGVAALPGEITETITHPGAIAIPGLRDITSGFDSLWKRVRGIGRTLTPAGAVGLVAASVLSLLGLGWLKCSNVAKAGKRLCGLNSNVLDGLLAGLFAVFGTIGLVVFAHDVQRVFEGHAKQVIAFWRADTKGPGGDRAIGQRGASV